MPEQQFADNREYLVVHRAVRKTLGRFVTATERGEPAKIGPAIGERWAVFARLLHHHHEGEDEKIFPAIAAVRPDAVPLMERLEREHQDLVTKLDAVDAAVAAFEAAPDADHQRAAHDAFRVVQDMLVPHLDIEDAELLPVAAESVPNDLWQQLGEEMFKTLPKRDLPVAAGVLDEVVHEIPESEWPPPPPVPVRVLLALVWRRRYRKYMAPLDV